MTSTEDIGLNGRIEVLKKRNRRLAETLVLSSVPYVWMRDDSVKYKEQVYLYRDNPQIVDTYHDWIDSEEELNRLEERATELRISALAERKAKDV